MSFNLDITPMTDMAATIFNGLGPIFLIVAGVSLGIGLLTLIIGEIRKIV